MTVCEVLKRIFRRATKGAWRNVMLGNAFGRAHPSSSCPAIEESPEVHNKYSRLDLALQHCEPNEGAIDCMPKGEGPESINYPFKPRPKTIKKKGLLVGKVIGI